MNWMKQNRLAVIVVAVIAVVLIAASFTHKEEIEVRAETAQIESIRNTISTNGKIEAADNFEAHASAPAIVKRVYVHEGEQVKAGQILVQLDDAEARSARAHALAQLRTADADISAVGRGGTQDEVITTESGLAKAKAERDTAQRNADAMKKLFEKGSASAGELREAETRLHAAQADVSLLERKQNERFSNPEISKVRAEAGDARAAYDAAEELLKNLNIRSPRAGTVYSVPLRQGSFANPGDLLVQVAQLNKMQVRAFVDEPEIGKLAIGQKVIATWDALPGRTWEGSVSRVPSTVVTRGTRNVGELMCTIDNSDLKLLPNVNVNVMITTAQQDNSLTVSREAVYQENGKRFVFTVEDGRLKRHEVQTGISSLTRIQIKQGLQAGTKVAVAAANSQNLADGIPAKIVEQ
jgi:HlyD family secretion protein